MTKMKIALALDLGFASLPVPDKIIIPIGEGKIGPFSYKQHGTNSMTAEKISIEHAGQDRLKISARVTGRIAVSNFPDLRLGGFQVEAASGLAVQNMVLRLIAPQITKWDMPNVPAPFDNLVEKLLNKFLLKKLTEALEIDLQTPVEKAMAQINRPNIFEMAVGKNNVKYEFNANVESFAPELKISPDGLHLNFTVTLAPAMTLLQPQIMRAATRLARARRRVPRPQKRGRRKTT